mgnify:CR=1 FL=1
MVGPELATLADRTQPLEVGFLLALLLVGGTVVALATNARPRGLELGIVLGVVAAGLLLVVRAGLPAAERTHLIEYAALAALIHAALLERAANGRRVPSPALSAIAITTLIGVIDELLQAVIPGRVFDPVDIAINAAAVSAVALGVVVRWAARRRAHRPS